MYCYLRSPYRDLSVYDSVVQVSLSPRLSLTLLFLRSLPFASSLPVLFLVSFQRPLSHIGRIGVLFSPILMFIFDSTTPRQTYRPRSNWSKVGDGGLHLRGQDRGRYRAIGTVRRRFHVPDHVQGGFLGGRCIDIDIDPRDHGLGLGNGHRYVRCPHLHVNVGGRIGMPR